MATNDIKALDRDGRFKRIAREWWPVPVFLVGALLAQQAVLVMRGNLRVIDDLVAAGYSHTPTDSVPDVADHALANSSIWYAVVAALVVVALFRWRRHIGNRAAIGAAIATVLFPPWIIPGAGVIVLAIVRSRTQVSDVTCATGSVRVDQVRTSNMSRCGHCA